MREVNACPHWTFSHEIMAININVVDLNEWKVRRG